jgi:hypothetical protein
MKRFVLLIFAVVLTACGVSEPSDTVASLAENPERLKELRQRCNTDRAKVGDALCDAVAEATRKRFIGDGNVPYSPPQERPKY